MPKTIVNYSRMSDASLNVQAESVLVKMTGNPAFPHPTPDLATLETDLLDFRSAIVDASLKSRQTVIIRDQKRAVLEKTLRQLAYYVDAVADGDRALILGSGFECVKDKEHHGPCPKPTGLRVAYGPVGSGEARVRVKRERMARAYRFEYRLSGTESWTEQIVTRSSILFSGLESLKEYDFRVAYIGSHPAVQYSETVSSLVL